MPVRNASAVWQGDLKSGKGTMRLGSGAFEGQFSFASRFEEGTGTNPEELAGAAHAGCFSMAFSNELSKAGFVPTRVATSAKVHLEKGEGRLRDFADRPRLRGSGPADRQREVPGDRGRRQEGLPDLEALHRGADQPRRKARLTDEKRRSAIAQNPKTIGPLCTYFGETHRDKEASMMKLRRNILTFSENLFFALALVVSSAIALAEDKPTTAPPSRPHRPACPARTR